MAIDEAHDPAASRFWRRVEKDSATGCWNWTGSIAGGYGRIRVGGVRVQAHRFSFEMAAGEEIPAGLYLDHLCRNQRCVNPAHLEAVTPRDNVLRSDTPPARQARQTHCKRGHALSGTNLYLKGRHRECRTCQRNARALRYAERGG
jgi:hypothetical protein